MVKRLTIKRLSICYIVLLFDFFIPLIRGDFITFPVTPTEISQTTGSTYSWTTTGKSNCGTSSFAEVYPLYPSPQSINALTISGWDYTALNSYNSVSGAKVSIYAMESVAAFFSPSPPIVNLKDGCGNNIGTGVQGVVTVGQYFQRDYSWTFPNVLSADMFKQNFAVEITPVRSYMSPGSNATFGIRCVNVTLQVQTAQAVNNTMNCSTSPSPSPSAPPSVAPNASPSRTPSPSRSPGSASSTINPSPTASSHSPRPGQAGSGSTNTGLIAGIVIGAVVGICLLAGITFLVITKRKKKNNRKDAKELNMLEANNSSNSSMPLRQSTGSTGNSSEFQRDSTLSSTSSTSSLGDVNRIGASVLTAEIYIEDVKLKGLLGKGKFGEVYEGLWHGTTAVACKKLKKDDKEEFENEIVLLMCVHAASGMVFLEQKNIVHRDLGARNLLVTEADGRYVVKISDFGLSRQVEDNEAVYSSQQGVFPVKWSPPEVINYRKFTSKSDVWSFAVTMWEIFELGKVPYPSWSNDEAVAQVMKGYRLPRPDACPETVYTLMLQCWSANPEERPNFKAIHEQLQQVLKSIKGEEEELKYQQEDADRNYNRAYNESYNNVRNETYNNVNNNQKRNQDTYNNAPQETYNTK